MSALHWAALNGHDECCKLLLEKGASVNVQAQSGYTPLHVATLNKHFRVVALLMKHNADPKVKDGTGKTVYEYAESSTDETLAWANFDKAKMEKLGMNVSTLRNFWCADKNAVVMAVALVFVFSLIRYLCWLATANQSG